MVAALIVMTACSDASPSGKTGSRKDDTVTFSAESVSEIDAGVQKFLQTGLIKRVDAGAHEVQVNPHLWGIWDADAKKAFTQTLAIFCEIHDGRTHKLSLGVDSGQNVAVIDSESGKKLASYSPTDGFKVY
jgi:hypothetical protein